MSRDPFSSLFEKQPVSNPLVASLKAMIAKVAADLKADQIPPTLAEKEQLEARVLADYQAALGTEKRVNEYLMIHQPVAFTPANVRTSVRFPVLVRVIETPVEMLYVWHEGWIDPSWLVELVDSPSDDLLMICATGYGPNGQTFKF